MTIQEQVEYFKKFCHERNTVFSKEMEIMLGGLLKQSETRGVLLTESRLNHDQQKLLDGFSHPVDCEECKRV